MLVKTEIAARIFVDKMKSFCPKRRLPEDYFESDLKAFLPPVNEGIDEVASALSESLRAIFVNQQSKWKNKQPNKDRQLLKKFLLAGYHTWSAEEFKE